MASLIPSDSGTKHHHLMSNTSIIQPSRFTSDVHRDPGKKCCHPSLGQSTTEIVAWDKLIQCSVHRLWKHLMSAPSAELTRKLQTLSTLIDCWENEQLDQSGLTESASLLKYEFKPRFATKTMERTCPISSSGISSRSVSIETDAASSASTFVANANGSEDENPPKAKRIRFNIEESLESEDDRSKSGKASRHQRGPVPFGQKSPQEQIVAMLSWLHISKSKIRRVMNSRTKIRKDDFQCDTRSLSDSFLDESVHVELLQMYFEGGAFRALERVLSEKKKLDFWICGTCHERVVSKAIFCDECLIWYHYKCADISSTPDKNANWFCRRCLDS